MKAVSERTAKARHLPGAEGVWVFVGVDMVFFAMLFASFMFGRLEAPAVYETSRLTLDADFGGINTLILLTSSWFVVMAVEAARAGRLQQVPRWLAAGFACGLVFAASKVFEYSSKLQAGITPQTNDFYMYYYVLTGFHMAHVIAGSILLLVLWLKARQGAFSSSRMTVIESGATYWHMVDLLWIILFPLLYLMR
jgi:nitric oxide reductase NorE protein